MNREQKIEFILQGVNRERTFIAMSLCNRTGTSLLFNQQSKDEEAELTQIKLKLNISSDEVLDEIINRIN